MKELNSKILSNIRDGLRVSSIRTRLVASFLILSLVPLGIIGVIAYNRSNKAIMYKISTYSEENMKQVASNIKTLASKYEVTVNDISLAEEVQNNIDLLDDPLPLVRARAKSTLDSYMTRKMIGLENPIYELYCSETVRINSKSILQFVSKENYTAILEKTKNTDDYVWTLVDDGDGNFNFLITYKIVSLETKEYLGIACLVIPHTHFSEIFADMNLGNGTKVFMINDEGTVIASREPDIAVGHPYEPAQLIQELKANPHSFDFNIIGSKYLIASSPIPGKDWRIVSTIPYSYLSSESNAIRNTIILVAIACLIFAVIFAFLITLSISDPLKNLVGLMAQAKSGNLAINLNDKKKDEIGEVIGHFNSMVMRFRELLTKVSNSANKVHTESDQLATYAARLNSISNSVNQMMEQVALGAQEQAHGVSNSVASMNHLANNIKNVEEKIVTISDVVVSTQKLSGEALESVDLLNEKAMQTKDASLQIAENINDLYAHMKEIKSVLKVISNISEQTHLLALNATIEAARAGASGQGFGVVANEIKKLADQSHASTKNIQEIINTIQAKADVAVEATRSAEQTLLEQMQAVNKTDESFKLIYSAMESLVSCIEDISLSIQKVSDDRNITLESMAHISAVVQESAATTQEVSSVTREQMEDAENVSALSKSLEDMAKELMESVTFFKIK
jgi:methyl-accepting chemotaxis protein